MFHLNELKWKFKIGNTAGYKLKRYFEMEVKQMAE